MEDNILIQVNKNGKQEIIKTGGYLLLYLEQGAIKFTGTMELSALSPLILKLIAERMTR